jgi:hypothetical protein
MKVYIVFDKETGEVVHKYRVIPVAEGESEDTVECDAEEVLSSYRGPLPRERLEVALIADYHPQTSRGRATRYNSAKSRLEHEKSVEAAHVSRLRPADLREAVGMRKE